MQTVACNTDPAVSKAFSILKYIYIYIEVFSDSVEAPGSFRSFNYLLTEKLWHGEWGAPGAVETLSGTVSVFICCSDRAL